MYVTDRGSFGAVNEAYAAFFPADRPHHVGVRSRLPKGADVEIDAIVALPEADGRGRQDGDGHR